MPEEDRSSSSSSSSGSACTRPGGVYDIVRHHREVSFNKAKHLIQKSKVRVIESSANLFHQCIKPLSVFKARTIVQQCYDTTRKDNLKLTYLATVDGEGLYTSASARFYGSSCNRLNEQPIDIPDTLHELEAVYESIIGDLSQGKSTALRGSGSVNLALALTTMPYHTSPELNPRLEAIRGINIPTARLGSRNSIEQMHKTFGLLDRVDVLHWGACRLWLVVQLEFERALELRLANQLTRRGCHPSWCTMPTYHKEFVVLPSLLRKWQIPFEIIVQKPGDLVHLRDWVPHQVIDLGTNISETVSVGSVEWNMNMSADKSSFLNCPCGTKHQVGDNNFGANTAIYARVELLIPRTKPMPCTHVHEALLAAKSEYNSSGGIFASDRRHVSSNYNAVPVLKEYRKPPANPTFRTKPGCKCYACGKRSDDLKSHLSRHILCRAKLNLYRDAHGSAEEPLTDESDDELAYDSTTLQTHDLTAKFRCAYCIKSFDDRIQVIKHVAQLHRQNELKRSADDVAPVVKKRRKKQTAQ